MDGVMKGKLAYEYDPNRDKSKKGRFNSLVTRTVKKGSVCADLCSGTGISIEFLLAKAGKVYGVEASPDMVKICKERFASNSKVEIIKADVSNTTLKNSSVDYVLIRMGLHHIKDKSKVLAETFRILRRDGKVIIIDKFAIYPKPVTIILDFLKRILSNEVFLNHYYVTLDEFESIVKKNNFSVENKNFHSKGFTIKANFVLAKNKRE